MSSRTSVEVSSPAKVNPRLEVLARRPDGQHEVSTTLLALDLFDGLEVSLLEPGRLEVELAGPAATEDVPADERNLAVVAARLTAQHAAQRPPGLRLRIHKRIPSQAGLGGGSSNAAAAALAVCRLMDADPDDVKLLRRLGELGADVPFFLAARRTGWALAAGRGERIRQLPAPNTPRVFVLLTPEVTCATGEVYAALEASELRGRASGDDPDAWLAPSLEEARRSLVNDLEAPALRVHPRLAELRRALNAGRGEPFRLSGSGSSFFGLFADMDAAEAALEAFSISRTFRDHGLRVASVAAPAGRGVALRD